MLNPNQPTYSKRFHGLDHVQRVAPKRGVYLEFLSWKEVEHILHTAKAVLLPLGSSMKEHGLHLPMNNDWLIAEYLTMRVLDEISIPSLPTMQYGYYPAFVEYPGSIHISQTTARDLIIDVSKSIANHGPKKLYILNTGFSTNRPLEAARQMLANDGITMEYLDLLKISKELEKGVSQQSFGSHADEIETSMMLYMLPEVVKLSLAKPEISSPGPGPFTRNPNDPSKRYTATGAYGDPTLATVEKGRIVTERLVEYLINQINSFQHDDFVPVPPRQNYLIS